MCVYVFMHVCVSVYVWAEQKSEIKQFNIYTR